MALPRPKKESEASADELRGIRNVKTRESGYEAQLREQQAANNERFNQTGSHTVAGRFEKEKSIEAQAYSKNQKEKSSFSKDEESQRAAQNLAQKREAANAASYEQSLVANESEKQNQLSNKLIQQANSHNLGALGKAKGVSSFARWSGLAAVATAFAWQFVMGILSLVGFGVHSVVGQFKGTWFGSVVSFFVDLDSLIPGMLLGWVFWGISSLIAICVFLAYLLYYAMTGVNVFHSTMSVFITCGCFALSLLPVTNLFPWLLLWIIYMNATSLFSSS